MKSCEVSAKITYVCAHMQESRTFFASKSKCIVDLTNIFG